MRTFTIKREMVDSLESDTSKLDFVNSVISLLSDREPPGMTDEVLEKGLNIDLPEQLEGAPEFDSSNMGAAEYRRFSMVRAGFFPVRLNCGYSDYTYKHRDKYSDDALVDMFCAIYSKKYESKGKKDFLVFLNYYEEVLFWYRSQEVKLKKDNHC